VVGCPTDDDIQQLQGRLLKNVFDKENVTSVSEIAKLFNDNISSSAQNCVCLLPLNSQVKSFNAEMMKIRNISTIFIPAIDNSFGSKQRRKKTGKVSEKASDTTGLETSLEIGLGARVMLRRNIDLQAGLVNGSMGTVTGFIPSIENPSKITVRFDFNSTETHIERISVDFNVCKGITVKRQQFPLCLCYGMTIHKSQGLSLDCVVTDLGMTCFQSAMAYVALSRCRRLSNLYLINFEPSVISAKKEAIFEYNRLRSTVNMEIVEKCNVLPEKYAKKENFVKIVKNLNFEQVDGVQKQMNIKKI